MINARVTTVNLNRTSGDAQVFCTAPEIASHENPHGFVSFFACPEYWTGEKSPRVGEMVSIGRVVKKITRNGRALCFARDVAPAKARKHHASRLRAEPTELRVGHRSENWWEKLLGAFGLSKATS